MKIPDIAWPTFFYSYRESKIKSKRKGRMYHVTDGSGTTDTPGHLNMRNQTKIVSEFRSESSIASASTLSVCDQ